MGLHSSVQSLGHVLIVDDCPHLGRELQLLTSSVALSVTLCPSLARARAAMIHCLPHVVLLDHALPDGTALDILDELNALRPKPIIVGLSGSVSPEETFRLARLGMSRFLAKPFSTESLFCELEQALTVPPDIEPQLRDWVGRVPIKEAEHLVRSTMVEEALAKSAGNRRGAARLLSISRQMLQQVLRLRRSAENKAAE